MFSSAFLKLAAIASVLGFAKCDITFENYESLGVFKVKDIGCNGANPQSPDQIAIQFELFTEFDAPGEVLDWTGGQSVINSKFNPNHATKFLIHGWNDEMSNVLWTNMRDELLKLTEPLNVICVDWSKGASKFYTTSRDNTRVVGRIVGKMVDLLVNTEGATYADMHIIGHSLGAQTAGYAGEATGGRIGRLSGLDPAGPLFGGTENACRLDSSDAVFIDAMHTDGDLIGLGGAGLMDKSGHHDWYPFGGKDQPGCKWWDAACDHMMAIKYYTASIQGKEFPGSKWGVGLTDLRKHPNTCNNDCPKMGYYDDPQLPEGAYGMDTEL